MESLNLKGELTSYVSWNIQHNQNIPSDYFFTILLNPHWTIEEGMVLEDILVTGFFSTKIQLVCYPECLSLECKYPSCLMHGNL